MTTTARQPKPTPTPTPDLAGLLTRRPPPARTPPAPGAPLRPGTSEQAPAPRANLAAVAASQSPATPGAAPRQYLRSITVYLPRDLFIALGDAATQRGTTRTALTLIAINATYDRLGAVLNPMPSAESGLFDVPQSRATPGEPSVQTTMRVTDAQLAALTDLSNRYGAARSHVIAAALRSYLNPAS